LLLTRLAADWAAPLDKIDSWWRSLNALESLLASA